MPHEDDAVSLSLAADLAASLLLFIAFALHAVAAVVLFALWRALRAAERAVPAALGSVEERLEVVRAALQQGTRWAVMPQIEALAVLAGARAGWSALVGGRRS